VFLFEHTKRKEITKTSNTALKRKEDGMGEIAA